MPLPRVHLPLLQHALSAVDASGQHPSPPPTHTATGTCTRPAQPDPSN